MPSDQVLHGQRRCAWPTADSRRGPDPTDKAMLTAYRRPCLDYADGLPGPTAHLVRARGDYLRRRPRPLAVGVAFGRRHRGSFL
jgi:hypothetical protein